MLAWGTLWAVLAQPSPRPLLHLLVHRGPSRMESTCPWRRESLALLSSQNWHQEKMSDSNSHQSPYTQCGKGNDTDGWEG